MHIVSSLLVFLLITATTTIRAQERLVDYGVDVSYPMHHAQVSQNYPWLPHNLDPTLEVPEEHKGQPIQHLGNVQAFYDKLIDDCDTFYGDKGYICHETERDRILMNRRQIQSMINYTQMGFTKMRAPPEVFELLQSFWTNNRHRAVKEDWSAG